MFVVPSVVPASAFKPNRQTAVTRKIEEGAVKRGVSHEYGSAMMVAIVPAKSIEA